MESLRLAPLLNLLPLLPIVNKSPEIVVSRRDRNYLLYTTYLTLVTPYSMTQTGASRNLLNVGLSYKILSRILEE